jgi:hypothetical protein
VFEQLITNADPSTVILIIVLIVYVGKEFFIKKSDQTKLEKDVSAVSSKSDNNIFSVRQETTGALHNLENKIGEKFTAHSDKFYEKIADTLDKVDQKYLSKEINKQQIERMNKFEERLENMEHMLSEVKTTGDVNTSKLDSVVDMIEALSNKIDKINKI